jgi:hypothetical protein
VADIGVDIQQAAERAAIEQAAHLLHRRLVAPFMADAEHAAGLRASHENTFRACRREPQWLFTEHLLAGGKRGDSHFLVQQMRRHHRDRVDVGSLEQIPVADDEIEAVRGGKGRNRVVIDVAAGHHLEARACRQAGHDLLAPPAEPDNADPDHAARVPLFCSARQCGLACECAMAGRNAAPIGDICAISGAGGIIAYCFPV